LLTQVVIQLRDCRVGDLPYVRAGSNLVPFLGIGIFRNEGLVFSIDNLNSIKSRSGTFLGILRTVSSNRAISLVVGTDSGVFSVGVG